jgi:hypothetical protein
MGATPEIIATCKRKNLRITWTKSGYCIDGIITARNLSAAQVLRYIAAATAEPGG